MFKNKIYKHLSTEIFKNFLITLFTFSAIAWTVRAVNFLDLMIEDGYSASIYFKYSLLNIFTIISRFVPLSFLLASVITVTKFERQQEFLILWTAGLNKIKIANLLFLIGFIVALFQIMLSLIINPFTLNKSRILLRETESIQVESTIRSNDFSDTFKGVTFYIDYKDPNDELINIFIKDSTGSISTLINEVDSTNNITILAKKGFVAGGKLVLFNGTMQSLNENNILTSVDFKKTELSVSNFSSRTITQPKIQETMSSDLIRCLLDKKLTKILENCPFQNKTIIIETLSRRIGMPLYIPLISIIVSSLLIYKKEKKYIFTKKYIVFSFAFTILILAEILLRFVGFSSIFFMLYFIIPVILGVILYTFLINNMISEKVT